MAITELWSLWEPSSHIGDSKFFELPRRTCVVKLEYDKAEGGFLPFEIHFKNVHRFRCTYLPSLTYELTEAAHDRLVDMGDSEWFLETVRPKGVHLRHLSICFDDGPLYDFICDAVELIDNGESVGKIIFDS